MISKIPAISFKGISTYIQKNPKQMKRVLSVALASLVALSFIYPKRVGKPLSAFILKYPDMFAHLFLIYSKFKGGFERAGDFVGAYATAAAFTHKIVSEYFLKGHSFTEKHLTLFFPRKNNSPTFQSASIIEALKERESQYHLLLIFQGESEELEKALSMVENTIVYDLNIETMLAEFMGSDKPPPLIGIAVQINHLMNVATMNGKKVLLYIHNLPSWDTPVSNGQANFITVFQNVTKLWCYKNNSKIITCVDSSEKLNALFERHAILRDLRRDDEIDIFNPMAMTEDEFRIHYEFSKQDYDFIKKSFENREIDPQEFYQKVLEIRKLARENGCTLAEAYKYIYP